MPALPEALYGERKLVVMNIKVGDIVLSKQGRDKGKLFFVIELAGEEYVLLADGNYRRVDNPKKKKLKHISHFSSAETRVSEKLKNGEQLVDAQLRKAIRQLENPLCEGG